MSRITKHDKATWFAFADKLPPVGYALAAHVDGIPVTDKGAADIKILAAALLARTISNLKATLALVRMGRVVEARTIARCVFENLFMVAALVTEGDAFVKEMLRDDLATRKLRAEQIIHKAGQPVPEEWELDLRVYLKDTKKYQGTKTLTPKSIAEKGPVDKAYLFYSWLSADAGHPTTEALSRYLTRLEEDGAIIRSFDVDPVPDENELAGTLLLLCNAVIGVYVSVNQILGGTATGGEIATIADEYRELSKEP